MTPAVQAPAALLASAAAATAISAWRGAGRPALAVKHAYWLLGLAGALFGLGAAGQQALAGGGTGSAFPLGFADLPGLLALAALVTGVAWLGPRPETRWHPLAQRRPGRAGTAAAHLADGYVLASALFIIYWLTLLGPAYAHSGAGAATFAAQLVHPLADLLVLGALLPLAVAAGRRGVVPFLALLLLSAGDALSVGARVGNGHPGVAAIAALLAGVGLLGAAPWLRSARAPEAAPMTRGGRHASTVLAALVAASAALVAVGYALAGQTAGPPVLAVAAGAVLLALTARIVILVHRDSVRARLWHEAGQQFRELAGQTSDAVLVCDYAGRIGYASPAVADYGYPPERLAGQVLTDLVHPEDRLGAIRMVREAAGDPTGPVRYTCRVRAADGTWRYVAATVSRHLSQGAPDRLLVTARDVSDQVALRRQIAHLTYHDGLTGLPNRAYLEERARDALPPERPAGVPGPGAAAGAAAGSGDGAVTDLAPAAALGGDGGLAGVILLNLDLFTAVNEADGPAAGDLVLAQVARRLRATVPPQGMVGRWGGDEFAVLLTGAATAGEILDCAERIRAAVAAEPFRAAGRSVTLTASLGVALADGSPAGYVWRNAQRGVAAAKKAGGGRVETGPGFPAADANAPDSVGELNEALAGGELEVAYQPLADLASGQVVGAVAQLRWCRLGEVPAESPGAAGPFPASAALGDWLLRESCSRVASWHRSGWEASLWLSCDGGQVSAPGFTASVLDALAGAGLAPHALILEVPAQALLDGGEAMTRGLGELRERGTQLAVDISGAGFAAVARLGQLPVNLISLGPGLVAALGPDTAAETLARAAVAVGRDLDLDLAAAGIERAGQLELLARIGVRFGRGPLLSGPLPPDGVALVAAGAGRAGAPPCDMISPAETNALSS